MTKEINKNIRFNSEIRKIEKVNPMFSRATIRVLYTGFNRNGSYFSKDSVLKSIDSIYNIPLVGEYIEHADNFGDHGTSLEIKGNEIKLVQSTKPYGLIPESANIYWENVTEVNGIVNEYLVVDGAYLWTGRYEELNTMLENPFNQSMEIEVVNGNFAVIDGRETFNVDEFLFSALCILGIDKEGEGHVEPAFESANITTYSLDKDDFKKQFSQMVAELKFSLEQGGKKMEKEIPAIQTDSPTPALDMFTEAQFAEATEMNVLFDAEPEVKLVEEVVVEEVEVVDYEAKFNELSTVHTSLQSDFATLKTQLDELNTYKRQREESDIKAKFEGKLSDEEFTQVFTELKDSELEVVEDKIFALIGKKNFSIQSTPKSNINKVAILNRKDDEKSFNPYGDIFEN